jgi:Na+/H+ antiporter NhaD/arsenite permease-like protein
MSFHLLSLYEFVAVAFFFLFASFLYASVEDQAFVWATVAAAMGRSKERRREEEEEKK